MTEQEEKIARLPVWAREHIKRLEHANEPMLAECVRLHRENARLADRAKIAAASNEALMEILRCASRGGSDVAATIVSTLEGYEIFRTPQEAA